MHRQELLLKACLLEGAAAREAFRAWEGSLDDEPIDLYSLKLVPLLYRKLAADGIESSRLLQFEAIYRVNHLRNLQLFGSVGPVLQKLSDARVTILILKGAILTEDYYKDRGVRY